MFDTHAHLTMLQDDLSEVVARAAEKGVSRIVNVGMTAEANSKAIDSAAQFPGIVFASIGYDRDQAAGPLEAMANDLEHVASEHRDSIVAIGETGLDFHYHPETPDQQIELFSRQLDIAGRLQLPVIVHSRDAEQDTLHCLSRHAAEWKGVPDSIGIVHCFTGSLDFALKAIHLGYMISFSGIVTFKNVSALRETAAAVPEDMLLVETDSPYLAPEPQRGRKNEPSLLPHVVSCLAEIRGTRPEEMAKITEGNACRLFGVSVTPVINR